MFSKPLAVGLLAVGCVSAAAGGAYVAGRHHAAQLRETAAVAAAPTTATPVEQPVAETEAVVTPASPAAEVSEPPAPDPAPRPVTKTAKARAERSAPRPAAAPARPAAPTPKEDRASVSPSVATATTPPAIEPLPAPVKTDPPPVPIVVDVPRADPPAPPPPVFEELVVPAESVIGLQVDTAVSSDEANVEDRVEARVTRDVIVDGRTAIPAGSRALGTVTVVERGGKMKDRARLGVRFHSLVLADGTRMPIRTEAIFREGESPTGESARKIGGAAVGGAIIGAIIGGKKGAVVGGATGAGAGTAIVMAGDRNAATLPAGTVVTIRLSAPVMIEVEKQPLE